MNLRLLAFLFLPIFTIQADDRLGFATHFQQGWNADAVIPKIVESGAGMIRDDIGWWNCEPSKGKYTMRSSDVHWISVAGQAGLKIVLCLQYPPPWYRDASGNPYDPTAYGNMAAWLAQQCVAHPEWNVVAIEVLNEPNNISYFKGSAGLTRYVALLNSAYEKVKAVNALINVIGLGMQGDQNFTMMAQGAQRMDSRFIRTTLATSCQSTTTSLHTTVSFNTSRHGERTRTFRGGILSGGTNQAWLAANTTKRLSMSGEFFCVSVVGSRTPLSTTLWMLGTTRASSLTAWSQSRRT